MNRSSAIIGLLLSFAVLPAWGSEGKIRGKDFPWINPKKLNVAEIDLWIRLGMSERRIPGMGITIVQGDKVLLSRAYGHSQPEEGVLADTEKTLWRAASISKLFTTQAVMQLVEQGKIGLDDPIAPSIKAIGIPEFPGKPITLRHLLTHTAGFDEVYVGIVMKYRKDVISLERWLRDYRPKLVQPPGESTSYSNYGVSLAGYVVQQISGVPFARYIDEHVFKPLEMARSTFDLREDLNKDLAKGHEFHGSSLNPVTRDYIQSMPASSLETTVNDMSHFLISQLNGGRYNGNSLVSPASLHEIQRRQYTNHPELNGFGLTFFELTMRGVRFLAHGGDARGSDAFICIFPDQKLAFFLAYNRAGNDLGGAFLSWFMDQLIFDGKPGNLDGKPTFSAEDRRRMEVAAGREDLSAYHGVYRFNRYPHVSFTKLGAFLGGLAKELRIGSTPDGLLEVIPLPWDPEGRSYWSPLGDGVFANEKTGNKIVVRKQAGVGENVFRQNFTDGAFYRIPIYDSIYVHLVVLGFCEFIFLSYLFWRTFTLIRYWHHRRLRRISAKRVKEHFGVRKAQVLFVVVSVLNVIVLPAWGGSLVMVNPIEFAYGVPIFARILFNIPRIGAGLSGVLAVLAIWMWFRKERRPPLLLRLKFLGGSIVTALYFLVIGHWNFFGFWD